jgi:hypothetical protein
MLKEKERGSRGVEMTRMLFVFKRQRSAESAAVDAGDEQP